MWFWRKCNLARWDFDRNANDPDQIELASQNLRLRTDEGALSLFQVLDLSEAQRVAIMYVFTVNGYDRPDKIDFLLVPPYCLEDMALTPRHAPDNTLHPFLSQRHYEVSGIDEERSRHFAQSVLQAADRHVLRLGKSDLPERLRELLAGVATIGPFLKGRWAADILAHGS
jgi:hypothetical protein